MLGSTTTPDRGLARDSARSRFAFRTLNNVGIRDDISWLNNPAWQIPCQRFAAAVATREAADAKKADRNTAREVRRQWLAGRVGSLIVKDAERADLLRILLLDYLEYGEVTEADEALSGIPPMGDRNTITDEQREWIAAANENRLWKALLVLTFGLATCGSEQWPHDHWQSIRVAQALGYEPSDVEVELLGGAT